MQSFYKTSYTFIVNEEDEVEWLVNEANVDRDDRCIIEEYGYIRRLVIRDIVPADSGSVASVRLGVDTRHSELQVEETPVTFVRRLDRRTTAVAGAMFALTVELSHAAERVTWTYNGAELDMSDAYRRIDDGVIQGLQLLRPTYKAAGRYAVLADTSESSTLLDVEGRPVFDEATRVDVELDARDTLNLRLHLDVAPAPDVLVLHKDESLFADVRTSTDFAERTLFVSRKAMSKADRGEYTIKATNEFGESTRTVNVRVNDVPEAPTRLVVTEVGADSASVSWQRPIDDGGAAITGYYVEKKDVQRRVFQRVGQASGQRTTMYVEDLDWDSTYVLRVAAINRFGTGPFSDTVEVATGVPYTAPRVYTPPTVALQDDQSVLVEWDDTIDDGGSKIYSFDVYAREDANEWTRINSDAIFTNSYTVRTLKAGVTYAFKVEATSDANLTSNSNVASEPITMPSTFDYPTVALTTPDVTVTSLDTATITWQPLSEASEALSYKLLYKSEGATVWNEMMTRDTTVQIENLKEGVGYTFKLGAINSAGAVGPMSASTKPTIISAYQRPAITKPLRACTVSRKRELRLDIHALGEPAPSFEWRKDGVEIVPTDDNISIDNEGYMSVLVVRETDVEHGGVYECKVWNAFASETTRALVTVGDVRAHFLAACAEHLTLFVGNTLLLECELSDEDATVVWLKQSRQLRESDRVHIQRSGPLRRLVYDSVSLEDGGEYMCMTSDERSFTRSRVIVREEVAAVRISPQDQQMTSVGTTVTLRCELTRPVAIARWLRNGVAVDLLSGRFFAINEDAALVLNIVAFDDSAEGEYVVELPSGERSAPAHLTLQIAPRLELSREARISGSEIVMHAGSELAFTVLLSGHPHPRFEALLNGEPLRRYATIDDFDDNAVNVRFGVLGAEHAGELSLRASSACGDDVRRFTLRVLGAPPPPADVRASLVGATTVEVTWSPASATDVDASPLEHYIVERKAAQQSRWRTCGRVRPTQPLQMLIDELFADELYVIRVVSVNEIGRTPSMLVEIITPPDDDDLSLMSISSAPGESSTIDTPARPTLSLDDGRARLEWTAVDGVTLYAIERRREGDELWLELATTDRTAFIDRSIATSAVYSYRVVARVGRARSRPSNSTPPQRVEARELRRSTSLSTVGGGADSSASASERSEASDRSTPTQRSVDDSGVGLVEAPPRVATTAEPKKKIVKKKIVKPTASVSDNAAAAKPPRPQIEAAAVELDTPLQDVEVAAGATAVFECRFAGADAHASSRWSKDGVTLDASSARYTSKPNDGLLSLTIAAVAAADGGLYRCELTSGTQSASTEARLTLAPRVDTGEVHVSKGSEPNGQSADATFTIATKKTNKTVKKSAKSATKIEEKEAADSPSTSATDKLSQAAPVFDVPLSDLSAKAGAEVVLDARVSSRQLPAYEWRKDGVRLGSSSRRLEYTDRAGVVRLNIAAATGEDAGRYELVAKNDWGTQRSACTLVVIGDGGGEREPAKAAEDFSGYNGKGHSGSAKL